MICSLRQKRWIAPVSLMLMMVAFLYIGSRSGSGTGTFSFLTAPHTHSHTRPVQQIHQHRLERLPFIETVTDSEAADKTARFFSDILNHPSFLLTLPGLKATLANALKGLKSEPAEGLRDGTTIALRTVVLLD